MLVYFNYCANLINNARCSIFGTISKNEMRNVNCYGMDTCMEITLCGQEMMFKANVFIDVVKSIIGCCFLLQEKGTRK